MCYCFEQVVFLVPCWNVTSLPLFQTETLPLAKRAPLPLLTWGSVQNCSPCLMLACGLWAVDERDRERAVVVALEHDRLGVPRLGGFGGVRGQMWLRVVARLRCSA